jgi:signal peptidase I
MPLAVVASKYVLLVVAIWFVFSFVFSVNQMSGETMYPRLRDGDLLLSYRLERSYEADDVVLYENDGLKYVSRVVAQAGDVVNFTEDGYLSVNGYVQQEEKVYYASETDMLSVDFPYTVPEDSYFVLNDYRTYGAYDSRQWGAIPQSDLVAKVISLWRFRGV